MPRRKNRAPLKGLGQKYGATVRKRYSRIYRTLKQKRRCPECNSLKLRRIDSGIWGCQICGFKIAGGAYDISA